VTANGYTGAAPGSGTGSDWADITSKPTTFPPSDHDHVIADTTGLQAALDAKAASSHGHAIADTTGLQTALDAKAALTVTDALDTRVDALEAAPGGGGGTTIVVKRAKVTSGNIVPQASVGVWSLLTGSPVLTIPAAVGDYVAFDFPALLYGPSGSTTFLDLAVVVSGSPVRYQSTDTATPALEGSPSLYPVPSSFRAYGPTFEFVVTSGDLDSGNVNVRFAIKGPGVGTIYASTDYPLKWRAINYGEASVS
jgi:hypothetical protein